MITHDLLGNAVQHGGTTVSAATGRRDGHTAVTVTEKGPGISTDNSAQIFAALLTTRRDHFGTGMGLTIVTNLLQTHCGSATLTLVDPDTGAGVHTA
ncbi:MAG: ATP-binding protein [Alphaproteobacteria bacterium]